MIDGDRRLTGEGIPQFQCPTKKALSWVATNLALDGKESEAGLGTSYVVVRLSDFSNI